MAFHGVPVSSRERARAKCHQRDYELTQKPSGYGVSRRRGLAIDCEFVNGTLEKCDLAYATVGTDTYI